MINFVTYLNVALFAYFKIHKHILKSFISIILELSNNTRNVYVHICAGATASVQIKNSKIIELCNQFTFMGNFLITDQFNNRNKQSFIDGHPVNH